jgi:hypothetical protein
VRFEIAGTTSDLPAFRLRDASVAGDERLDAADLTPRRQPAGRAEKKNRTPHQGSGPDPGMRMDIFALLGLRARRRRR